MDSSVSSSARNIAQVARAFEQQATGRSPSSVAVVLNGETLVITLRGTLSPGETAMARTREGAARLRELHRQLFATGLEALRREISRITGVAVREATAEVEPSTGTVVQVFSLAQAVPSDSWSGGDPGPPETQL